MAVQPGIVHCKSALNWLLLTYCIFPLLCLVGTEDVAVRKVQGTIHVPFQYMSDNYHDQTMGIGLLCVFSDVLMFRNNLEDGEWKPVFLCFLNASHLFILIHSSSVHPPLPLRLTRLELYKEMKSSQ